MSKAFTRESDDDSPRRVRPRQSSGLPPGAVNYLTEEGARRLREELDALLRLERPRLLAEIAAGASTLAPRLAEVEGRIETLQAILRGATIVPAITGALEEVRFGATVTLRQPPAESELRYRVVGVDEAGLESYWVSWRSEIGVALLHAVIGQKVALPELNRGESAEVLRIEG